MVLGLGTDMARQWDHPFQSIYLENGDLTTAVRKSEMCWSTVYADKNIRVTRFASFQRRWIGRGGAIAWPARFPDLTLFDFFLWGCMKEKVHQTEIASREELVAKINTAAMEIHQHGLDNVQREVRRRAKATSHLYCRRAAIETLEKIKKPGSQVLSEKFTIKMGHTHGQENANSIMRTVQNIQRKQNKRRQDQQQPVLKMANSKPKHVNSCLEEEEEEEEEKKKKKCHH
ncbi:hypothetical protein ANN_13510 [Periplaneta americana]|uniref:Uncharacterized protein n=1 Tax=Periplaneta americana TaxID=6978 RepID=A0ABQ8TLD1_PERAM|nr:hypothetical protein ANN_13510 [Periplaneta americana]